MELLFLLQAELIGNGAQETLRELSPWAYVIVLFAVGVAATFLRLYTSEKNSKDELEKEFRLFMSDSLTKQIEVSKDVIDLVSGSKKDMDTAMGKAENSDSRIEALLNELRAQLSNVERLIGEIKNR